jgi:prophage antirepressor-like protein
MNEIIKFENIEELIVEIKGQKVLLDRDVANIYGVETKRINESVKNNPEKFPEGYIIEVDNKTKDELVENFDRFKTLKHSTTNPKAFTEKGLYMLATILKSKKATEATITIKKSKGNK